MGLFGNNKELQSGIGNHGEGATCMLAKRKKRKLFYKEKKEVGKVY